MDFLIISITILAGFALFVGVVFFVSLVMPPSIKDHFKGLYKTVRERVKYPGRPRNPYSLSEKANNSSPR